VSLGFGRLRIVFARIFSIIYLFSMIYANRPISKFVGRKDDSSLRIMIVQLILFRGTKNYWRYRWGSTKLNPGRKGATLGGLVMG
jgi:hypothetical protein